MGEEMDGKRESWAAKSADDVTERLLNFMLCGAGDRRKPRRRESPDNETLAINKFQCGA